MSIGLTSKTNVYWKNAIAEYNHFKEILEHTNYK